MTAKTILFYSLFVFVAFLNATAGSAASAAARRDSDYQQCAIDLCGPAANYLPARARGAFESVVPLDERKILDTQAQPLIEELFDAHARATLIRTLAIDDLIKRAERSGLNDDQRALMNIVALTFDGKAAPAIEATSSDEIRVDAKKHARFSLPLTNEVVRDRTIEDFRYQASAAKELVAKSLSAAKGSDGWQSMLIIGLARNDVDELHRPLASMRSACDALVRDEMNDVALATGPIVMSWQAAMFSDFGAGAMAHEIGHIVAAAARSRPHPSNFNAVRACSAQMHADIEDLAAGPDVAFRYVEEDWADAFGVATLRRMRTILPRVANFACYWMSLDRPGLSFSDLSFRQINGYDTHSAALLRALQVHIGLGLTAPQACSDLLPVENSKRWPAKSCLDAAEPR